jgi:hypothetical protein
MAAHFIDLAAFLVQAKPPAFFQGEIILDQQYHDHRDAREGKHHHRD